MKCKTCAKKLSIYALLFMKCPYCKTSLGKTIIHKAKGNDLACGLGIFATGTIIECSSNWKNVTCKKCLKMKK